LNNNNNNNNNTNPENLAKIGPVDFEIIGLREIVKMNNKQHQKISPAMLPAAAQ